MATKKKKIKVTSAKPAGRAASDPGAALLEKQPFNWRDRRDLIHVGLVAGVALVLRLFFFYMNQRNNPVFNFPIMDALYHNDWATDILQGGTPGEDVFFRGPLYPYLLAGLYKISGSSIAFATFFQHLLGVGTSVLTFLLAREYFNRPLSLAAGLVAALYWPFVYFEGDLLIVSTILFLNALCFWCFARAMNRHSALWFGAAGLFLGLSTIARPSILIFFPAIPWFIYLTARNAPARSMGWIKRTAVVAVMAAVSIVPVMVRNWMVGHAVVPVAASGGVNFYIGNNPLSDGSTAIVPGTRADWWGGYEDAIAIAERDEGRKMGLADVSNYYFRRGLDYITSRPGEAWAHMGKKLRIFWAGPERANNKFIYFFWNLAGMKYVPLPGFWLVAPFGLLGMVLLWPRRQLFSMHYLFVVTYMVGVVAFFVNARFRLPVVPMLILFASFGGGYLWVAYRRRSFQLLKAIVLLMLAVALVNSDYLWFQQIRAYSDAFSNHTLGNAYMKVGRKDTALSHYMRADEINRQHPTDAYQLIAREVNYNMGTLLWEQGLCSRAVEALERVGGTDDIAKTALDHLGDCYLRRNDVQRAAAVYNRLVQIDKNDVRGVTGVARCQAAMGNLEEAERMLESIVDPSSSVYPPSYIALAEVQRALGKTQEAIKSYTDISRFAGYEKQALMALVELYQSVGDIDAALRTLDVARNYFQPGDPNISNLYNTLRTQR